MRDLEDQLTARNEADSDDEPILPKAGRLALVKAKRDVKHLQKRVRDLERVSTTIDCVAFPEPHTRLTRLSYQSPRLDLKA